MSKIFLVFITDISFSGFVAIRNSVIPSKTFSHSQTISRSYKNSDEDLTFAITILQTKTLKESTLKFYCMGRWWKMPENKFLLQMFQM